jgi:hypothetical protein
MPQRRVWEWRYNSTFLDLGTGSRWVVSFQPLPLSPRGKTLDWRLGGPQSRSGRCREENIHPTAGNQIRPVQPVARRYINWANPAQCYVKICRIEFCHNISFITLRYSGLAMNITILWDVTPCSLAKVRGSWSILAYRLFLLLSCLAWLG